MVKIENFNSELNSAKFVDVRQDGLEGLALKKKNGHSRNKNPVWEKCQIFSLPQAAFTV
jgi:hypothetical protein